MEQMLADDKLYIVVQNMKSYVQNAQNCAEFVNLCKYLQNVHNMQNCYIEELQRRCFPKDPHKTEKGFVFFPQWLLLAHVAVNNI